METNKQNEIRNAYEHSAQVQCIPASIKKTTEHSEEDPLVVAPYCRVSTDNKDQLASYELQCQYYKEYVSKHPEMYALSDFLIIVFVMVSEAVT